jgi:hypothetical protein
LVALITDAAVCIAGELVRILVLMDRFLGAAFPVPRTALDGFVDVG